LERLVAASRFRSDLYFRLNVFTIRLPPLRERGEDLIVLADYYLRRFGRELDRDTQPLPEQTLDVLRRYPWPGNIRELQSVLKQGLLQMRGAILLPEFLPPRLLAPEPPPAPSPTDLGAVWDQYISGRMEVGSQDLYAECLSLMERQLITRVLQRTEGNQLQAARILGITRNSLRHKIRTLNISIERFVCAGDDPGD
jgi:DNA-binding NtrC family response regulator